MKITKPNYTPLTHTVKLGIQSQKYLKIDGTSLMQPQKRLLANYCQEQQMIPLALQSRKHVQSQSITNRFFGSLKK
jgi:hypothetical protein